MEGRRMNATVNILSEAAIAHAVEVLKIRAQVRAYLEYEHQFEHLADAVDPLQEYAERSGLVAALGQDAVQDIIATPFGRFREIVAEEIEAVIAPFEADLAEPLKSTKQAYHTPQATVDAFFFVVRTKDADGIGQWLSDHPFDARSLHKLWKQKCSTAAAK
jgi:hypothetical protein